MHPKPRGSPGGLKGAPEVKTMTAELENSRLNPPKRSQIQPGMRVRVVEKQNQRSGRLTEGVVRRILTSSPTHPHGIKGMGW